MIISPAVARERLRLKSLYKILGKILEQYPERSALSSREGILLASILKLMEMVKAVDLLAANGFVEEIQILSRTMAEIVINSAYLQCAQEAELARFVHFDTQAMYKHAKQLQPHVTRQISEEDERKIEAAVRVARSRTGKDDKGSWSKKAVVNRAEFSDQSTGLKLMVPLALSAYAYGHSAIHGTYDALEPFMPALGRDQCTLERVSKIPPQGDPEAG